MGHEWITRQAAVELLGGDRWLTPDPSTDPRTKWPTGARAGASELNLAGAEAEKARITGNVIAADEDYRFAAIYKPVLDAILGERWVDIGGINFAEAKAEGAAGNANCLDAVTQEAADVQYDHFMRKVTDVGAKGGIDSARESKKRFIAYFAAAAMARDGNMLIWDGGGWSEQHEVERHYFLFGRALHLFEDSFSPDHTVRIKKDYFRQVQQVKSYLCAGGSEQHAHLAPTDGLSFYDTGDVIWASINGSTGSNDWSAYAPSNMRDYALAATEGTKEAWAAFIRTMAKPEAGRRAVAVAEATKVADKWLGYKDDDMRKWYLQEANRGPTYVKSPIATEDGGGGTTVKACMDRDWKGAAQATKIGEFARERNLCIYNMLPAQAGTDIDPSLHIPYDWSWRNKAYLEEPPAGWKIEGRPSLDVTFRIANKVNGQFLRQESGYIYNDPPKTPGDGVITFSATIDPTLPVEQNYVSVRSDSKFLNRAGTNWGLVGLYGSSSKGQFSFTRLPNGYYSILNTNDKQYMYMYTDQKSYVNGDGNPKNNNSQWIVDGMPEPYLLGGQYTFAFSNSTTPVGVTNGRVTVGASSTLWLERNEADSSYFIRAADGKGGFLYVRESADRKSLVLDGSPYKFYLAQTQDRGQFNIQGESGFYWLANPNQSGTLFESVAGDGAGCGFNPCDLPVAGMRNSATRSLPGCEGRVPVICRNPVALSISRVWPAPQK